MLTAGSQCRMKCTLINRQMKIASNKQQQPATARFTKLYVVQLHHPYSPPCAWRKGSPPPSTPQFVPAATHDGRIAKQSKTATTNKTGITIIIIIALIMLLASNIPSCLTSTRPGW